MGCTGDKSKKCGGDWRNDVYATGRKPWNWLRPINVITRPFLPDLKPVGCFNNKIKKGKSKGALHKVLRKDNKNTPARCAKRCLKRRFKYAAVQKGNRCLCGNRQPKKERLAKSRAACNKQCPGNPRQRLCGGRKAAFVYRVRRIRSGNSKQPKKLATQVIAEKPEN